jgi:hypothetical protein
MLPPAVEIELIQMKFLALFGSPEKVRSAMTRFAKKDAKWLTTLKDWEDWYVHDEIQNAARVPAKYTPSAWCVYRQAVTFGAG